MPTDSGVTRQEVCAHQTPQRELRTRRQFWLVRAAMHQLTTARFVRLCVMYRTPVYQSSAQTHQLTPCNLVQSKHWDGPLCPRRPTLCSTNSAALARSVRAPTRCAEAHALPARLAARAASLDQRAATRYS